MVKSPKEESLPEPVYAGFWIRFVAFIIDNILLAIVGFFFGIIFGFFGGFYSSFFEALISVEVGYIIAFVFGFYNSLVISILGLFYYALMESSTWQATFGKKALNLKVIDYSNNRISFDQAITRILSKILSGFLGIGYLMIVWTNKNQGLHDKMVDTFVVVEK